MWMKMRIFHLREPNAPRREARPLADLCKANLCTWFNNECLGRRAGSKYSIYCSDGEQQQRLLCLGCWRKLKACG